MTGARRGLAALGVGVLALASACGPPRPAPLPVAPTVETDGIVVTGPTVIAYLVVPPGAVDADPDLAVTADDWSYAMAFLGDSLQAHGIAFTMATAPRLRVRSPGAADATLALDAAPAAGYIFARPGEPPCLRRGAAEPDAVIAAARDFLGGGPSPERRARAACAALPR